MAALKILAAAARRLNIKATRVYICGHTRALLLGTFLQTLPEFGYATEGALDLNLRAPVHRRCQRLPKGLSTNKIVEAS